MVESSVDLLASLEFHHIGYATTSIAKEAIFFASLGYRQEGDFFCDPIQGVNGCFMTGPGPRVELLENSPGSERLTTWLNAGIKLYHFAYLVKDSLQEALNWARGLRAKVNVSPVPAVAFGGRRISFVTFRNGFMVELIEKHIPDSL